MSPMNSAMRLLRSSVKAYLLNQHGRPFSAACFVGLTEAVGTTLLVQAVSVLAGLFQPHVRQQ
jgi:hypothetical protein